MDGKGIRPSRALFNRPKAKASAESPPPKDAGEPGALDEWPKVDCRASFLHDHRVEGGFVGPFDGPHSAEGTASRAEPGALRDYDAIAKSGTLGKYLRAEQLAEIADRDGAYKREIARLEERLAVWESGAVSFGELGPAEPGALRAALERTADLPEDAPPPGMQADWYAAGWGDRGDALCAALSATQDGTPGLDEERLARILHEVLPEDAAEHAPHGDRYCDYIADCIVDRYDDPDWPTPRLSTSEPRREDEG